MDRTTPTQSAVAMGFHFLMKSVVLQHHFNRGGCFHRCVIDEGERRFSGHRKDLAKSSWTGRCAAIGDGGFLLYSSKSSPDCRVTGVALIPHSIQKPNLVVPPYQRTGTARDRSAGLQKLRSCDRRVLLLWSRSKPVCDVRRRFW